MGYCRAIVELNRDTLIPKDLTVNTWYFEPPGAISSSAADITTALDTFYTAIGGLLSPVLTGTGSVAYYDLEDPEPRVPVATGLITFTPDTTGLPEEVALCLSFQGAVVSGEAQARRRGRVYLGPLSSDGSTLFTGYYRPSSGTRSSITTAANALMGTAGINWSVFSPTTAGPPPWAAGDLANAFTPVTNGWVDDTFDTQRRRGAPTTARTVFP